MSQERFTETIQAPGSDASSGQGHVNGSGADHGASTFLTDPRANVASSTIIPNSNSDGAATPKLYSYELKTGTGGLAQPGGSGTHQGTICSEDTSTMDDTQIASSDEALAVERSNMRFHQMLAKLNSIENIHSFEVTTETVPSSGVPIVDSTFTITYLRQPVHYNAIYTPGELTVKRLAAEGVNFDDTDATQMRHVWKPKNEVTASGSTGPDGSNTIDIKQIVHRENVTAVQFSTVATLYGNMTCDETIVNPTHSLP
jgi:hypothetical protein